MVKKFLVENSLSLTLFLLFFISLTGLAITGFVHQNEQLQQHGQSVQTFGQFVVSAPFYEAVFENWESEFLQMGALVVLTIWLYQKGAADSRKLRGKEPFDASSRYSIISATSWRRRTKAIGEIIYANSLSIALFSLFLVSFILHAINGVSAANQEAGWHGGEQIS